jgi:hypothetical protein
MREPELILVTAVERMLMLAKPIRSESLMRR